MRLSIREDENAELLRSSIYFSAVCLVFYLYAFPMFQHAARFYGGDGLTFAYAVNMLGNACGYFGYSCLVRRGLKQKTTVAGSVLCLLFAMTAMFFIRKSFVLFLATVLIAAVSNGVLGALAHWSVAVLADGSKMSARFVGCAYAAALALQYIIVHVCRFSQPAALAVGLVITGVTAFVCAPPRNWLTMAAPSERNENPDAPARSVYVITIACVAVLTLAYGLYDGVSSNLHAHNELSVWAYPRLFSVVGVLAAAWIADIGKRAYLSASMLCFFIADTAATLFLRSPATYALSQSLQYLFSGAFVMFFTISFMDIAPRSKEPTLWAGMGRAVYSAVLMPLLFVGRELFGWFGELPIICFSMAVFAVTIILLVTRDIIIAADRDKRARTRHLALFQAKFSLTDREAAVVHLLLKNEDTVDTIAAGLNISIRTCQRAVTSIYEKTGVQTRAGLLRIFHES